MNKVKIGALLMGLLLWGGLSVQAQIGEHRNDFSIGFNGGYVLSSVGFEPEVQQKQHGGMTAGLSMKYTCEKYFKTICSIYAESTMPRWDGKRIFSTSTTSLSSSPKPSSRCLQPYHQLYPGTCFRSLGLG